MKLYSAAEVEEQNRGTTKWIVNDGYIYDLEKFYKETPNGGQIIKELSLSDSDSLYTLLDSYIIGELTEFRQDMAVSNINGKFKKVVIVLLLIVIMVSSILIYLNQWIWLAFSGIILVEMCRRLYNLHDEMMEEIGVHSHEHSHSD